MKLVLLPGDGIGREISSATRLVLEAAAGRAGIPLEIRELPIGHDSLARYGTTVSDEVVQEVRASDGLILGPTATMDFRDPARGELNPSMFFRKQFDLFANIRPSRTFEGIASRAGQFDLVIVRENTEGFYADRNMELGSGEMLVTSDVAISIRRITRQACERIAKAAFELAETRRRRVAFVHKANVLKISDGLFLEVCREVASEYPQIETNDYLIDAMAAHVVRDPSRFDVIVTTNMYGDILSDLTAELSGSLGLGSSLNVGSNFAMAQAAHGSAPDIAGQDIANPASLILSAAQLLAWFGRRHSSQLHIDAGQAISSALEELLRQGAWTRDVGGKLGTAAAADALCSAIRVNR